MTTAEMTNRVHTTGYQIRSRPTVFGTSGGMSEEMSVGQLRRFQWAVRAALALGVAASVCANVLHARDNVIAQVIAAWPPLALMLTVELIARVPVHHRLLAVVRIIATAGIAGIAAYVSYFHMAAVVARYGEHQPNPYLLPISVDGLIVVASVSLVELSGRIRAATEQQASTDDSAGATGMQSPTPKPAGIRLAAVPGSGPADDDHQEDAHRQTAPPGAGTDNTASQPAAETAQASNHGGNGHQSGIALTPPAGISPTDANADPLALLPAARAARDELLRQGRSLSRDSLAQQLRRRGHTIRTSRVSELLTLLKSEPSRTEQRTPSTPDR